MAEPDYSLAPWIGQPVGVFDPLKTPQRLMGMAQQAQQLMAQQKEIQLRAQAAANRSVAIQGYQDAVKAAQTQYGPAMNQGDQKASELYKNAVISASLMYGPAMGQAGTVGAADIRGLEPPKQANVWTPNPNTGGELNRATGENRLPGSLSAPGQAPASLGQTAAPPLGANGMPVSSFNPPMQQVPGAPPSAPPIPGQPPAAPQFLSPGQARAANLALRQKQLADAENKPAKTAHQIKLEEQAQEKIDDARKAAAQVQKNAAIRRVDARTTALEKERDALTVLSPAVQALVVGGDTKTALQLARQKYDIEIAKNKASLEQATQGPAAAPTPEAKSSTTPQPLPKSKDDLKKGQIYQTKSGPGVWNGEAFELQ